MPRIRNERNDSIDQLFHGILALQDVEERLQVARMLSEGKTYESIRAEISTSSSTITRVNTELRYGSGGYQMILDRLFSKETAE